ncbi:MAG: TolC family protein [Myxococcales bacterium]|nr:TolC family protein [Myxococcales bacterium]
MTFASRLGPVSCALVLSLTACAVDDVRPDYDGARALITATTGRAEVYDPEAEGLTADEIMDVLADGLSLDEALRVALLNNRRFQADFMGLGIARADVVQAGLLENPTLGVSLLFPAGGGQTRLAADLAQNIMDVWRLPERRRAAEAGMEQRVLELARTAADLVADTRSAYYECVAARAARTSAEASSELANDAVAAVDEQVARGVSTAVDANLARSVALGADLSARRIARREAEAGRQLADRLSLTSDLREITLVDAIDVPTTVTDDVEALVAVARTRRLDLRAVEAAIATAEAQLDLEHAESSPDVALGAGYERPESDDPADHVVGPTLGIELPIFDRHEARIAKAEAELRQLVKLREALEAELVQHVRAAAEGATVAADAARFLDERLVPQAESSEDLARRAFEAGQSTLLPWIDARRTLLTARVERIEATLEAALAGVELERALGGPPPGTAAEG